MEKSQNQEKKGGRSHHVQVKCRIPGCSARVFEIKRHLQTHLREMKSIRMTSIPTRRSCGMENRRPSYPPGTPKTGEDISAPEEEMVPYAAV